jgi:V/A-type H+-transporting ATPase subunit E
VSVKDGLAAIANEVLGDVQKEAEAAILAAKNEAKAALKVAKEQADQNYVTVMKEATAKVDGERRRIASVTEVEIRNRLLRAKEALVDAAFEKAVTELHHFVTTEGYHDYLLKLIEEVAGKISKKDLVVQVNAKDKAWLTQDTMNRLSKKLHRELKLSEQTEDFIGGCKIQTVDGKITYDSTIDNRLQELKPTLRVEVAKIMFGKET